MLNAAIKQCPVFGGKIVSFDAAKVMSMPGVKKVVKVDDDAVAVVADRWWRAKVALDALPIVWDEGEHAKVTSEQIAAFLKEGLTADRAFVGNKNGDADAVLAKAEKKVEAVYAYPYQHHATMEPMNATARWTPDSCEVWCPTQNGEAALAAAARASGLPRLCPPRRPDRQGDARHADQAPVVARGGHGAWRLPPDHPVPASGRVG